MCHPDMAPWASNENVNSGKRENIMYIYTLHKNDEEEKMQEGKAEQRKKIIPRPVL